MPPCSARPCPPSSARSTAAWSFPRPSWTVSPERTSFRHVPPDTEIGLGKRSAVILWEIGLRLYQGSKSLHRHTRSGWDIWHLGIDLPEERNARGDDGWREVRRDPETDGAASRRRHLEDGTGKARGSGQPAISGRVVHGQDRHPACPHAVREVGRRKDREGARIRGQHARVAPVDAGDPYAREGPAPPYVGVERQGFEESRGFAGAAGHVQRAISRNRTQSISPRSAAHRPPNSVLSVACSPCP